MTPLSCILWVDVILTWQIRLHSAGEERRVGKWSGEGRESGGMAIFAIKCEGEMWGKLQIEHQKYHYIISPPLSLPMLSLGTSVVHGGVARDRTNIFTTLRNSHKSGYGTGIYFASS